MTKIERDTVVRWLEIKGQLGVQLNDVDISKVLLALAKKLASDEGVQT